VRGPARRLRWAWRTLWRKRQHEIDMQDEMRFHVEMEAERLRAAHGLEPREARRQALVRFGGIEKHKEEGHDARGLRWLDSLSLDARLGGRMLAKHRWLTIVGGVALAVAIAVGAGAFEVVSDLLRTDLPIPGGERVVAVKLATSGSGSDEERLLRDAFVAWRGRVEAIEQLGAYRTVQHNLVAPGAPPDPVWVAEMSASGFALAGTLPLRGRHLLPGDEEAGAAPVVVLGHEAWRRRFGADPGIVGRPVDLGGVPTTVVGVMPPGFAFPVDHQVWAPLRLDPSATRAWEGAGFHVFGRLAPGATVERAEAELAAIARPVAAADPERPARLQTVVVPFTRAHMELAGPALVWLMRAAQYLVGALALVVAVNLAILFYARTVTRLGEIAVRSALGASRRRILSQLFVEALALTLLGAAAGLMLADLALRKGQALGTQSGGLPFWVRYEVSPRTALYALVLAVVAALIMGVLPGVKATGRRLTGSLQELHGRAGTRLGSLWTTLIVTQVAVAVAVLPAAVYLGRHVARIELSDPRLDLDRLVVANMALSDDGPVVDEALVERRHRELVARLREEPGIASVTFSSAVPGFGPDRWVELEPGAPRRQASAAEVAVIDVDVDLLGVYGARLVAGRDFAAGDVGAGRAAIVNHSFATELLGPASRVLGTRFRYPAAAGETASAPSGWYEIVGVVEDFPGFPRTPGSETEPTVYHPIGPGAVHPTVLTIRFADGTPAAPAERIRALGAEVDASMQLRRIVPLSDFYEELRSVWRAIAWVVALVSSAVLLLSAAGAHALMSFTIAQRTREIGIRSALGAQPRHLLLAIFRRTLGQLGLGILAGSLVAIAVCTAVGTGAATAAALLATVAAVMAAVAALAALGPARRILSVQAIEALRVDG
jgi:putative ABC transport system permease protein